MTATQRAMEEIDTLQSQDATAVLERNDGAVTWDSQTEVRFLKGWLIERSSNGAAFLARRQQAPDWGKSIIAARSESLRRDGESHKNGCCPAKRAKPPMLLMAVQADSV